jgi:hypothetical protein
MIKKKQQPSETQRENPMKLILQICNFFMPSRHPLVPAPADGAPPASLRDAVLLLNGTVLAVVDERGISFFDAAAAMQLVQRIELEVRLFAIVSSANGSMLAVDGVLFAHDPRGALWREVHRRADRTGSFDKVVAKVLRGGDRCLFWIEMGPWELVTLEPQQATADPDDVLLPPWRVVTRTSTDDRPLAATNPTAKYAPTFPHTVEPASKRTPAGGLGPLPGSDNDDDGGDPTERDAHGFLRWHRSYASDPMPSMDTLPENERAAHGGTSVVEVKDRDGQYLLVALSNGEGGTFAVVVDPVSLQTLGFVPNSQYETQVGSGGVAVSVGDACIVEVVTYPTGVVCLSVEGEPLWRIGEGYAPQPVGDNVVAFISAGQIHFLEVRTGRPLAAMAVPGPPERRPLVVIDDIRSTVHAIDIDPASGAVVAYTDTLPEELG